MLRERRASMADFDSISRHVHAVLKRQELLQMRDGHQSRTLQIPSAIAVVVIVVVGVIIGVLGVATIQVVRVHVRGTQDG